MVDLLEFLRTHDEAFRSRSRLASLYSDFRYQRNTNPDGYQANASAWLRALSAAAKAGQLPAQHGVHSDRFAIRTGEELASALQTSEYGRPLALGAVIDDAVRRRELIPLKDFLDAKKSVYARSWIPSPGQVVTWGLKQLGVISDSAEDKLVAGNFVVMANVEAAAKVVLAEASNVATSNTSRIFSQDLFNTTFSSAIGVETLSSNDLSILLIHLSRDKSAIVYSSASGTIKFKAPSETELPPITEEDINIASIRTLISSLEPQINQLIARVADLDKTAKQAVANKQLTIAKSALRSKKLADTKLQQRTATLAQLEEVYAKIEQAADQVEMVHVMEASSQTLRSLNKQTGGVERVQDVVEGLREEMMDVDQIGQAINEVSAGEVDEGEVDDELEELERVEREEKEAVQKRRQVDEARAKEKKEEVEAERTRLRLAELDDTGKIGEASEETTRQLDAQRTL